MNPALSIIIPSFHLGPYLKEAVLSSLAQKTTYQYEVIIYLSLDKNEDASYLEKLKKSYPFLKIIYNYDKPTNPFLSRYLAAKQAEGKYLAFLDNDDLLKPNFVEKMVRTLEETNSDLIQCGFAYLKKNKEKNTLLRRNKIYDQKQAMLGLLRDSYIRGFFWNKVYKKDLFFKSPSLLFLEDGYLFEDVGFNFSYFFKARKIITIKDVLYVYRKQSQSLTSTKRVTNRSEAHLLIFILFDYFLRKNDPALLPLLKKGKFRSYLSLKYDLYRDKKNQASKKYLKEIKTLFKRLYKEGSTCKEITNHYPDLAKHLS